MRTLQIILLERIEYCVGWIKRSGSTKVSWQIVDPLRLIHPTGITPFDFAFCETQLGTLSK